MSTPNISVVSEGKMLSFKGLSFLTTLELRKKKKKKANIAILGKPQILRGKKKKVFHREILRNKRFALVIYRTF